MHTRSPARTRRRATAAVFVLALALGLLVAPDRAALASGPFDGPPSELVAWGDGSAGQKTPPDAVTSHDNVIKDVSAGHDHALAVTSTGQLIGWGDNTSGESFVTPALASGVYQAVAAGQNYSLALTTSGKVVAWGSSTYGMTTLPWSLDGKTVTAISAGGSVALALDSTGVVHAWGDNSLGQLEIPQELYSKKVVKISAGGAFAVAVTADKKVFAWGQGWFGQTTVPASVQGKDIQEIDTGFAHTIALLADGSIITWGDNSEGQLDVPTTEKYWNHVSAGASFSVGYSSSSSYAKVWGKGATTTLSTPPYMGYSPSRLTAGGAFVLAGRSVLVARNLGKITGSGRVGEPLTAELGDFKPVAASRVWGSWRIAGGPTISTGTTYTPTADQAGQQLVLDTNGELSGYTVATNNVSITVKPGLMTSTQPVVTGKPYVGQVLSASASFSPTPDRLQYDWHVGGEFKRATDNGKYTVEEADRGKTITVSVAAFKTGYDTKFSGFSNPTAAVGDQPKLVVTRDVEVEGELRLGKKLTAQAPTSTPEATSVTYQWWRGFAPILGATGATYTTTEDDLFQQVWVTATLHRDDYQDVSSSSVPAGVGTGQIEVTSPTTLTGTPTAGRLLTARAPKTSVNGTAVYQWTRNGMPIASATASTYRLTTADIGRKISVVATVSRPGWESATSGSASTKAVVKATPTLSATAKRLPRTRYSTLRVKTSATGLPAITTTLVVKRGSTTLKRTTLKKGSYVARIRAVRGQRLVITTYATSGTVGRRIAITVR